MMQRVRARKPAGPTHGRTAPSAVREVLSSGGEPLSADVRAYFEPRFGFDLGRVRVHADAAAAKAARSMDAAAWTVGEHIAFDAGRYAMNSRRGRRLLAHELTHVVQQNGAAQSGGLRMGTRGDASEKEADRAASSVFNHNRVAVHGRSPLSVQCQPNQGGLPDVPHLDLAENADPFMATAIGSMTIDKFATGKFEIPAAHKAELARTAKTIATLLNQYPGAKIRLVGHTDAVGKDADNQSLGQSRADSVQQALIAAGLPADAIVTESRGASDPRVKSKTENAQNRRVEMQFQPGRQFPGVMSKHLSLSGGGGGDQPQPSLFTQGSVQDVAHPEKGQPPYRPPANPDLWRQIPSTIPKDLMDFEGYNKNFTSHGVRPDSAGDPTGAVTAAYMRCMTMLGPGPKSEWTCKKVANLQISTTAGTDQTRDNPNTEDKLNQAMKQGYPNSTTVGPILLPPLFRFDLGGGGK